MKTECFSMILLAHVAVAGLVGCGGTGDDPRTVSFTSTPSLDGSASAESDYSFFGPLSQASNLGESTIRVGARHPTYGTDRVVISRGLLSFELDGLAGRTITNAELRVHVASTTAAPNDPFDGTTGLGELRVDHFTTNYATDTASSILFHDASSWSTPVPGAMSADQGWRVIDVRDEVAADQAAGRRSQFRLHFESELNVSSSQKDITIESGESTANQPVLVVTSSST